METSDQNVRTGISILCRPCFFVPGYLQYKNIKIINMSHLLYENQKGELRFNADTNAIELIWKKPQDEESYKELFTKGLDFLIKNKATKWLSDIRNQGVVGPAASKWVADEIFPQAVKHGLGKVAVVMKADIFQEFYISNVSKSVQKNRGDIMKYFDAVEDANDWLIRE